MVFSTFRLNVLMSAERSWASPPFSKRCTANPANQKLEKTAKQGAKLSQTRSRSVRFEAADVRLRLSRNHDTALGAAKMREPCSVLSSSIALSDTLALRDESFCR